MFIFFEQKSTCMKDGKRCFHRLMEVFFSFKVEGVEVLFSIAPDFSPGIMLRMNLLLYID